MAATNTMAKSFKALHKPGYPIILANVYDVLSARAVAVLPNAKALATASYAVARAHNSTDDELDLETNLAAVKEIAIVAKEFNKPLSVDIQDAYGARLEEAIGALIDLGVVGVNLEDVDRSNVQYSLEEAASRVKRAMDVAKSKNVPDFVVNARIDSLLFGKDLTDVQARGIAYLNAGASNIFVWGGSKRGVRDAEVAEMVRMFDGRLNVSMKLADGALTVPELQELGVARISVGPQIQLKAMQAFADEAAKILVL